MKTEPIIWLYNLTSGIMISLLPAVCLGLSLTKRWKQIYPRLGFYNNLAFPNKTHKNPRIWLQAVSVGEVMVALTITKKLLELAPTSQITITSTTEEGLKVAKCSLEKWATVAPFPLDLPWAVWAAIQRIKPQIYVSLETEIWPNLLSILQSTGVTCLMLNGRLSNRSFAKYQKIRPLIKATLKCFTSLSMISQVDAKRIIALGAEPNKVQIDGNIKYDNLVNRTYKENVQELKKILALKKNNPFLIAGSVHAGEAKIILAAFMAVLDQFPNAVLAIAPRHIKQTSYLLETCQFLFIPTQKFSALKPTIPRRVETRILIIDVIGKLMGLYGLSQASFIGGSLVPLGGHNPMEAAAWGVPCFWGPSMEDFSDAAESLIKVGAGEQVNNAYELAQAWLKTLGDQKNAYFRGSKGREVVTSFEGAATKSAKLILNFLDKKIA